MPERPCSQDGLINRQKEQEACEARRGSRKKRSVAGKLNWGSDSELGTAEAVEGGADGEADTR